jgi:tetratricopeptide (TPR) repeat protein
MKYTLFIDESGDFEESEQWVVGGVLCRANAQRSRLQIRKALQHLPAKFDLDSSQDLHLTDLRREFGHEKALEVASEAFHSIASSEVDTHLLAAVNESQTDLREPERTYRLMVLDLIALSATALTDEIKSFEVVIATRTKDGERMTTLSEIGEDVIGPLRDALEVDLVSRGLTDSIRMGDVQMKGYNESWGLIPADFISNVVFNRKHPESKQLVNSLASKKRLRVFTSFAKHAQRRAFVAEREGNLALALKRWALLETSDDEAQGSRSEALQRLCTRLLQSGTEGPRATLEAFIETVWRNAERRHEAYSRVVKALQRVAEEKPYVVKPLVFRLRDMMHLLANRSGDIEEARRLIELQQRRTGDLATRPRYFHLALKSRIHTITSRELMLDLEGSYLMADEHHRAVEEYRSAWRLLEDEDADSEESNSFQSSRIYIKAAMTRLRAKILSTNPELHEEALDDIDEIEPYLHDSDDQRRLNNYRILALLRVGKTTAALDVGIDHLSDELSEEEPSEEDFYHLGRAAAEAALRREETDENRIEDVFEHLQEVPDENATGHPTDLIWRELGLGHYLLGGQKGEALRCFRRSAQALETLDSDVPAIDWRHFLLDQHKKYIEGEGESLYKLYEKTKDRSFTHLVEAALGQYSEASPVKALRAVSPA